MIDELSEGLYSRYGASHPNPAYNFLTGFAPRKLKDLLRWAEYLYINHSAIFAVLQKLASYTVTTIKVVDENQALTSSWEDVLKNKLKVRPFAIQTGIDLRIYGNSFASVYAPFRRDLVCGHCRQLTQFSDVKKYVFQLKTLKVKYTCLSCNKPTIGTFRDTPTHNADGVALVRWDPKLIDIDHNPITGKSRYYYTIPSDLQARIKMGSRHLLQSVPMGFLEAVQRNVSFCFSEGKIYHMKMPAPAGIDNQWGLPPLLSAIKPFFHAEVLRKANEAIALDHIVPMRVVHPAAISGQADPTDKLNMARWVDEMRSNMKAWRRDPNHITFAPAALGVTMMGGQGRSLLVLGELKEADDAIIASLMVPREFVYGGLTVTGSGISLRMLENQLESDAAQQDEQLAWIIKEVAKVLDWKPVDAHYIPFKFVDDTEQKTWMLQLHQLLGGPLSAETLLESTQVDLKAERKKKQQEHLDEMRDQIELQRKSQQLQDSASQRAEREAQTGAGLGYNPQAVLAAADSTVQQLMGMDPGSRQSAMDHLSQEDPVMYAVVKDRMATQAQMAKQQGAQMAAQQGMV